MSRHSKITRLFFISMSPPPDGFFLLGRTALLAELDAFTVSIAIQPEVGCHYVWVNTHCSGFSHLGENHCETGILAGSVYVVLVYDIFWQCFIDRLVFSNVQKCILTTFYCAVSVLPMHVLLWLSLLMLLLYIVRNNEDKDDPSKSCLIPHP